MTKRKRLPSVSAANIGIAPEMPWPRRIECDTIIDGPFKGVLQRLDKPTQCAIYVSDDNTSTLKVYR